MFKRVYVEITNVCNLSCSFCPGTGRPARFLAPAEFRILAERLRGHTEYLYLHVMGEPLLHPQLEELLAVARELGFRVCVTTNGTLLPRRGQALSGVHKVSVSLHSFEGNDCPGSMEEYLSGVWDFCRRASAEGSSVCPAPVEHRRAGQLQRSGAGLPGGTAGPGRAVYPHGPPGEPAAFRECFPGAGGKI